MTGRETLSTGARVALEAAEQQSSHSGLPPSMFLVEALQQAIREESDNWVNLVKDLREKAEEPTPFQRGYTAYLEGHCEPPDQSEGADVVQEWNRGFVAAMTADAMGDTEER